MMLKCLEIAAAVVGAVFILCGLWKTEFMSLGCSFYTLAYCLRLLGDDPVATKRRSLAAAALIGMLFVSAQPASACDIQQVAAAPVVAYPQPIIQPVVAQYPLIASPVVQQQAFYAQPVVQQVQVQKVQKQRFVQQQVVKPVRQDIKIRQRIRVR